MLLTTSTMFRCLNAVRSLFSTAPPPYCGKLVARIEEHPTACPEAAKTVLAPYTYLTTLPSKNVRAMLVTAVDAFYQAPPQALKMVERVVSMLHDASLLCSSPCPISCAKAVLIFQVR